MKLTLGEKIKRRRRELHLTQEALAGESITRILISRIESGDVNPSLFDQLVLKIRNCIALNQNDEAFDTGKEAIKIGKKIYTPDSEKLQYLNELFIDL
jgi:predicted transcriptional regulator